MLLVAARGAGARVRLREARSPDQDPERLDPARLQPLVQDVGAVPVERSFGRLDARPRDAGAGDLRARLRQQVESGQRLEDPVLVEAKGRRRVRGGEQRRLWLQPVLATVDAPAVALALPDRAAGAGVGDLARIDALGAPLADPGRVVEALALLLRAAAADPLHVDGVARLDGLHRLGGKLRPVDAVFGVAGLARAGGRHDDHDRRESGDQRGCEAGPAHVGSLIGGGH